MHNAHDPWCNEIVLWGKGGEVGNDTTMGTYINPTPVFHINYTMAHEMGTHLDLSHGETGTFLTPLTVRRVPILTPLMVR